MADLAARLTRRDHRLITLTGSGGVGKTRLALEVAHDVLPTYPHGVWFIDLAPLSDPLLLPQAVAATLEARRQPDRPVLNVLIDQLRDKRLLLVLDNCEHLIDACAQLADQVLQHCPDLKLLATSREALGIQGEAIVRVPSLSLPPLDLPTPEVLARSEAVQSFSNAPRRPRRTSGSRQRMRPPSCRSAAASTASPSRSSWPPAA